MFVFMSTFVMYVTPLDNIYDDCLEDNKEN